MDKRTVQNLYVKRSEVRNQKPKIPEGKGRKL